MVKLSYKFVHRKVLPQDFEPIKAENSNNSEQYYQPYIDQTIIKHFCCYSIENEIYHNTLDQKFICIGSIT